MTANFTNDDAIRDRLLEELLEGLEATRPKNPLEKGRPLDLVDVAFLDGEGNTVRVLGIVEALSILVGRLHQDGDANDVSGVESVHVQAPTCVSCARALWRQGLGFRHEEPDRS